MAKIRLDVLVQRQANISRSKAQGLIQTGQVRSPSGEVLKKGGLAIDEDTVVEIAEGPKYVSRGGQKLEAALDHFSLTPEGKTAIDVGASTGGFTDCMLQRGVARVYAVDVGYGQLAWKLRNDPRVVPMERTNIRNLSPALLEDTPDFFSIDCSFISLRLVLASLHDLLAPDAEGVALVKPQFEAGKDQVGKGGVVRDPKVHESVLVSVQAFSKQLGFVPKAVLPSPLLGPAGNREFLMHLKMAE